MRLSAIVICPNHHQVDKSVSNRPTSSRLKITGNLRGRCTGCIFAITSPRSNVTSKKNFSPLMAELSDDAGADPD
jgi:hypothetical protein